MPTKTIKKERIIVRACKDKQGVFAGFITGKDLEECKTNAKELGCKPYLGILHETKRSCFVNRGEVN